MPHLPTIANCFRVTLQWSPILGTTPANVMHFSSATGDEASLADALDNSWQNGQFGVVSSGTSVVSYDILPLDGVSATTSFIPDPQNSEGLDGQSGGDPLLSIALCVAFKTDERGPRKRGRIYLGPMTESFVAGAVFNNVDIPAIQNAWQDFNDALVGTGDAWLHGVASYKSGGLFTGISSYRPDNFPATMRRRLVASR